MERFRGGSTQICLENKDMGGGRESSNVIRGDHFSEKKVRFKGVGRGGGFGLVSPC